MAGLDSRDAVRGSFYFAPVVRALWGQDLNSHMFGNVQRTRAIQVLNVGLGAGSLAFANAECKVRNRFLGIDLSKEYVACADSRNPFPQDRAG